MTGGDPYIPQSWGGGCTGAELYKQFRERGMSKFEAAQAVYMIIRTHPDVVTDPELPAPLEIIPHPDNETITFFIVKRTKTGRTSIITLDGSQVRLSTRRPAEIKVPKPAGRHDEHDWETARRTMRNLFLRKTALGEEPDMVAELRVYFEKLIKELGGDMPSDRTLQAHIAEWRAAGDYDRLFPDDRS